MKITISDMPLGIANMERTIPNNKLEDVIGYYVINPIDSITPEEKAVELQRRIFEEIKRPIIQGRARELSRNPDITDIID